MAAPQLFKLAGRIASRMADKSADSGLARIEKIFGTPPRVPSPTTIEKIARSDEAFARGPVEYSRYRGPIEEVDEVILDAPLSRSERDYFANISKSGSGFTEKKLTAKDVEFFEDMMREGDPYDFMADIPSAKIRTDKKGNKYLRVQGEEDMNNLFKFIEDGPWDKGDLPPSLRRWDWDRSFKDVEEFKHGGGLSDIGEKVIYRQGGGSGEPRTIAEAKAMGKNYFINKHGEKLAAVTKEELDKSGLSLGDYLNKQNKFNQLMRSITPGLKPTQDLPTPIQEKLGKGIKERDYRIINPLLDKRIKYSQQQDINNPPSDQPTSVSQQMDTMREKIDRGRQEVDMRREMNKWINMGFVPSVHGSGADVAFDPVTGGSFVTIDDQAIDTTSAFKHGGGLSSVNKPITINGQPHSLAWIRPDEASALKAMGGSGKKVDGIPAYDIGEEFDWSSLETDTTESQPTVAEQISSYIDEGGADIMGGTIALDKSTGELADRDTEWKNRRAYLGTGAGDKTKFIPVTGGFGPRDDPGALGELAYHQTPGYYRLLSSLERGLQDTTMGGLAGIPKKGEFFRVSEEDALAQFGKEGYEQSRNANNFQNIFYSTLHKDIRDDKEDLDDEEKLEKIIKAAEKASEAIPGATFSKSKKFKGLYEDLPDKGVVNKLLKRVGPGALPSKLIAGAANVLTDLFGVIGTVEINGKGYHVKKDGTISVISPEDDPSYKPSQHHEPGSDVPEQEQKSTPAPAVAAAPPEKGPMQTYQEGLTSIESNQALINSFRILKGQYPDKSAKEILEMLGKDINEIDISEFDINE